MAVFDPKSRYVEAHRPTRTTDRRGRQVTSR